VASSCPGVAALDRLEAILRTPEIYELAAIIPQPSPEKGGRSRDYPDFMYLAYEALISVYASARQVEAELAHKVVRKLMRRTVKKDAAKLAARVNEALAPRWMARLYRTTITGNTRDDLSLVWSFDDEAFAELKDRELGKRIVFTDRAGWSTKEIVVAYRSQWEAEAAFRQLKNPEHASFRPIHHWTDQKIHVHGLYSVAALTLVNRAWREADRAGLDLSPHDVIETLAAIREVTLIYPPAGGKKGNPGCSRSSPGWIKPSSSSSNCSAWMPWRPARVLHANGAVFRP
jgi:uncharacterized protein YndB with AHSA1/START domain